MKTLYIAILTLVTLLAAHAQPQPTAEGPDCRVTFYDDNSSPALWHPTAFAQDAQGMIWISSWNGLCRYDGLRFENFKVQPGQGIDVPNDRIRNILPDSDGTLLCIIEENSVCRFDTRTCRYTAVSADEAREALTRHVAGRQGGGASAHVTLIGGTWLRGVHHEMVDRQQNRWYIAPTGVYKVTPLAPTCQRVPEVCADVVRRTYRDRQGRIWVCSKHDRRGEVALFDADMTLLGYLGRDGRLHAQHTPFYDIFCMQHDASGLLWLGSKPDGLFRLDAEALLTTGRAEVAHFFGDRSFYDIQEDGEGRLWFAVFGQGVFYMTGATTDHPTLTDITARGACSLPVEARKVRRLLVDDRRVVAATTDGFVVLSLDGQGDDLRVAAINHHRRDPRRTNSLNCSATTSLVVCGDRYVVTSESGGLNLCDIDAVAADSVDFTHLTTRQGLGSDIASSALAMPDGRLVVQSNNMLTLLRDLDDRQPALLTHTYFGRELRLSDAAPLLLDDGRLLLALDDGVALLRLDALSQAAYVPPIALTAVTSPDGSDLWTSLADTCDTPVLRLAPDQRNVVVRYAALDYKADGDLLYATSYAPKNEPCVYGAPTSACETQLYDLSPGTYTLSIRSTNALGLWCDNDRQLTVVVEPRFYETLWARVLFLLLIVAVAVAITHTFIYIRALERQRRETLEKYLALVNLNANGNLNCNANLNPDDNANGNLNANYCVEEEMAQAPTLSPDDETFMQRLMDYVEANLGNCDASVDDMASATATSRSSLNRKMRHLVGVSPADFLKEARLKRAALLLRTNDVSVSDVAYQCGFASPKYFAKCFKESMGVTPREMKDQATAPA